MDEHPSHPFGRGGSATWHGRGARACLSGASFYEYVYEFPLILVYGTVVKKGSGALKKARALQRHDFTAYDTGAFQRTTPAY